MKKLSIANKAFNGHELAGLNNRMILFLCAFISVALILSGSLIEDYINWAIVGIGIAFLLLPLPILLIAVWYDIKHYK